MTSLTRKFALAAVVAVLASLVAYIFLGWLFIYPLGPEHPQVLRRRLFDDPMETAVWVTVLFAFIELVALGCAFRLVIAAPLWLVATIAGVVPVLVLTISFSKAGVSFDTFPRAIGFFLLFLGFTFAFLYVGAKFRCSHVSNAA